MMSSFRDTGDFIRWNEEMSRKYDSESYHLRSSPLIRWIERRRVRAILDFLDAGPQDTVLEVGCGGGVVLSQIPAGRRWGLDLSTFALGKTRRKLADDVVLLQANAEQLPIVAGAFDKLVCTEVIEHVIAPRQVVREMARIASTDATVVITIPNEALIERLKDVIDRLGLYRFLLQSREEDEAYDSPLEGNEWHLHHFDRRMLETVIAGELSIRAIKAIPFSFLPLRYVVNCKPIPRQSA